MLRGVGLFLIEFETQHSQLDEQNHTVDALPSTSLQNVLIPLISRVTVRRQVVDQQYQTQDHVEQTEEDTYFRKVV